MANSFKVEVGTRNDCCACNPEQVMSELSRGNFLVSTNQGSYSPEQYTTSYIKSLFDALNSLEDFWNECKNYAGRYIKEFNDIPEPESIIDDTAYLDDIESTEKIISANDTVIVNDASAVGIGTVTATSLNIRSDANTNSSVLGWFSNGDKIDVLGYSNDGNWVKIKTDDGKEGYISKKYVSIEPITTSRKEEINNSTSVIDSSANNNNNNNKSLVVEKDQSTNLRDRGYSSSFDGGVGSKSIEEVPTTTMNLNNEETKSFGGASSGGGSTLKSSTGVGRNTKIINNSSINLKDRGYSSSFDGGVGSKPISERQVATNQEINPKEEFQNNGMVNNSSTSFVTFSQTDASSQPQSSPSNRTAIINTNSGRGLNFRTEANMDSTIYQSIPQGTPIDILEYDDNSDWAKISYDGKVGYVYKDYIKLEGE